MPNFRQHDVTDCGPACLSYVLYRHGLHFPIAKIRQVAGTNQSGTTALGLVETAESCGCEAKGLRCKFEDLSSLPLPAIAHIVTSKGLQHFVVICKVSKRHLKVMDPALGRVEKWTLESFKAVWTNVIVVLSPSQDFKPSDKRDKPWMRLMSLLKPHRHVVFQALVGVVLGTLLSLSSAIYIQKIVDNVIIDGNHNLLRLLGFSMLVILLVRVILGYFQSILILRCAQKIDAGLILGYYRHVLRLPQSFFDTMRVGEIISRVRDARAIRDFLTGTVLELIINPMILVFALAAMFAYSWQLAVFSLVLIPANLVIYLASDWINRRYQREIMERSADFDSQVVESLHSVSVVRSCGLESEMSFKTESRLIRLLRNVWIASRCGLIVGSSGSLTTQAFSIVLLWIGANLVMGSHLTAGELMSCNALAGYITGPIVAIIGMNSSIRAATTSTDRLYEILDLELEEDNGTTDIILNETFELKLESLSFHYPGRVNTLKDVTFTCKSGEITALAGPSGCGKSTILSLIQRHYNPDRGRILLGDQNIAYATLTSLRSMIAHVPQRIDMIAGTILDNLAPGEPSPDMPRLIELCKQIGIFEFIESLPRGFHTYINENGANLSGGQRQRIAVVRSLYAEAHVILLDEPSSALDSDSEQMLIETMLQMKEQGKIVIMAVHNQKLLELCDQKIDLEDGAIKSIRQMSKSTNGNIQDINGHSKYVSFNPLSLQETTLCEEASELKQRLLEQTKKAPLLGHINANVAGISADGEDWFLTPGRCDLHESVGVFPALFGFEIGRLSEGWEKSCGYVIPKILEAEVQGGVISVSWIPENLVTGEDSTKGSGVEMILPGGSHHSNLTDQLDIIAENLGNLKNAAGKTIPILFRCWFQQNGDHFWWGRSRCTKPEFKRLFSITVDYLREKRGVRNLLFVFSVGDYSDRFTSVIDRLPHSSKVDVIGLDSQLDDRVNRLGNFRKLLAELVRYGAKNGFVSAVTSLGYIGLNKCLECGEEMKEGWLLRALSPMIKTDDSQCVAFFCFDATRHNEFPIFYSGNTELSQIVSLIEHQKIGVIEPELCGAFSETIS